MKTLAKNKGLNPSSTKSYALILIFFITISSGCGTKKNTRISRAYHNLTARYNVYFNGNESLKAGDRKIKKTFNEDYTRILPVFRYEDKAVSTMVASEMDRTIKKCAKTIKTHSITAKPKFDKKKMTEEERVYLNQPEYCKWIDNAYLLMGKAHFFKREFETAKQTFLQVINKYKTDDTKYEAMLWLAKTYAETEEFKNAENVLVDLRKKKKYDKYYQLQMHLLRASMFMKQKDYTNAAQELNLAIEFEKRKKEKTRQFFILAQIYQFNSKYSLAAENYKTVIKRNPNYEMTFAAKINLAEIYEKSGGNSGDLKKQLKKMIKDDKNIDFLDQIYYALGKIELNEKNTKKAIEYFTFSSQSRSSNQNQKVKTYMALAEYYYNEKNFRLASAYYDSTASSMQNTFPDYENINPIVQNRKNLTNHLNIIETEDSLQFMARMPEKDRNKIIDGIIRKIVEEEQRQQQAASNTGFDPAFSDINPNQNTNPTQGGRYYFYNPTTISFGQTEFKKKWGDRKLADNWRRSNKQIIAEENPETIDSALVENGENNQSGNQSADNKKFTNKKTRDFYLQNIPLTEDQLAASNNRIEEALYSSAEIYYKDMNETSNAIKQYEKLLNRYPGTEDKLETYYNLYTINNKEMNYSQAEKYKQAIINEFPESVYAKILKDPAYAQKLIDTQKDVEKAYQKTYNKYINKEYAQVITLSDQSLKNFDGNELSANFIYLSALAYGELGNKPELQTRLEKLVAEYPESEPATTAKATLEVMKTKKYEEDIYKINKDTIHFYVIVFPREKTDVNKLKFKYISLNVEKYTQQDLQVTVQSLDPQTDMIIVQAFINSGKALEYYQNVILN
ncbi:MAG: tetratricopeptide repeat protein, partial [Bacteroidales bacterium]|nr:tetratricopeptide repeat protein [Bacteroidales bacterium]